MNKILFRKGHKKGQILDNYYNNNDKKKMI